LKQLSGDSAKGAYLLLPLSIGDHDQTSNNYLLVNINPTAALVDQFHLFPHSIEWMPSKGVQGETRFSSTCLSSMVAHLELRQTVVPGCTPDQSFFRAHDTKEATDL